MPYQPWVIGNWKMNGSRDGNRTLLSALNAAAADVAATLAVCPPFPFLAQAQELLADSSVLCGAQTLSEHDHGAYTGEVSATMLRELGCRLVLVGHSERRTLFGESDAAIRAKLATALRHGLTPVLCVGETAHQREQEMTAQVINEQLRLAFSGQEDLIGQCLIAYEPVWAIGTGKSATPELAQEVHAHIRHCLQTLQPHVGHVPLLYGGSVKSNTAKDLAACPDVNGFLVGGASLIAEEFLAIARSTE